MLDILVAGYCFVFPIMIPKVLIAMSDRVVA